MKYKVALHHSEEGDSISVPDLPGCWSQGSTEAEALANVENAICEYLEVAAELRRDSEVREVELQVYIALGKDPWHSTPSSSPCLRAGGVPCHPAAQAYRDVRWSAHLHRFPAQLGEPSPWAH
jgi:predicted RNase H-like HicB family nuclease